MKTALVVVAYGLPYSTRLFETARGCRQDLRIHLFRHSGRPDVVRDCERVAAWPEVTYYPYGTNRGVAKSWNEAMVAAFGDCDVVVFANDDVYFSGGDLDRLVSRAAARPEHYIVTCAGIDLARQERVTSLGYACFAMNRVAFDTLGCFDQNLFPIYCEDEDYAYRAGLAGLTEENCPSTMVHHFGSAAIRTFQELGTQNRLTHGRNLSYYRRKWGGLARQEAYRHPFDNAGFDHRIPPERRHAPYGPGFDRTDHDIVAV
ncbi:MAG TPA: glycosyltransferase [Micromonosporaceae bacterium]|nr:glycosyltransferase [Micromonosporaceae bacterium]